MKNLRIVSLLVAVSLITSLMLVPTVGAADIEELIKSAISEHRTFATSEQEDAIKLVEDENADVVKRPYTQEPWNLILSGEPALLSSHIYGKTTSKRTLTLEFMRGKSLTTSAPVSAGLDEKIKALKQKNDAISTKYDLDNVSVSESAAEYSNLEAELKSIYSLYNSVKKGLADEEENLLIDGAIFSGVNDLEAKEMFSEKITKLFKDMNCLMFAGQDTWEGAYKNLLCGENKITMGLILGSDGAEALANEDTMKQIFNYIKSSDILETVAVYQTNLYSNNFYTSNTALYGMIEEVLDDILGLPGMAPVKTALENVGWTSGKIVSAIKIANDEGDKNFYSRAINLNMILGRYLGVYKKDAHQSPVIINVSTAESDEYDVCVAKDNYKASVLNVLDSAVLNNDGTPSSVISADDEGKLKFTAAESDVADGYQLRFWRDGAEKNVYNYINTEKLDVINDDTVHVESVTIKQGHTIDIYEGESKILEAIISPSNADNKDIIWSVENSKIAKITQSGVLTGVSKGKTIITVTTEDGGFTATITVNVKEKSSIQYGDGTATPRPTTVPNPPTTPSGASHFVDLQGHWAYTELDELIKEGIVSGYGVDNFSFMPDAPITRAEFAVVMCKMMKLPITREGVNYSDTINHWSRDYVATVTKYGYMIGVAEDLFAPDLIIPREQVIAVILRAMAFSHNIMHAGDEITNDANDILNLVKKYFGYEYTDLSAEITDINKGSDWARAYVEMAYKGGYIKGYEDHTMRPLNNATRAEAMVMAKRVIMD